MTNDIELIRYMLIEIVRRRKCTPQSTPTNGAAEMIANIAFWRDELDAQNTCSG
jgi:hypothetical protein